MLYFFTSIFDMEKVLICCFSCCPKNGGDQGWKYIMELSGGMELYVVTSCLYMYDILEWRRDEKNREVARRIHWLWTKETPNEMAVLGNPEHRRFSGVYKHWQRKAVGLARKVVLMYGDDGGSSRISAIRMLHVTDASEPNDISMLANEFGIAFVSDSYSPERDRKVIITAPSLDPEKNVSGVSTVVNFIIDNNPEMKYIHFKVGREDSDKGGWHRVLPTLEAFYRWRKVLDNYNPGTTLIHYSYPLSAPSILRDSLFMCHARRCGYRMLVHVHGGFYLTAKDIPYLLGKVLKWTFSWDLPYVVLGEHEKEIIQDRFCAKDVVVLPNCPSVPKVVGRHGAMLENAESPLVMGYLGRIEPNKGVAELLEALKILKNEGVNFIFRLAGKEHVKDEFIPQFEDALGERFDYVGLVAGARKDAFLESLDVFVMPSYYEGLPMSLLESMGCGVVPVVTNVGSIADVVTTPDDNTGEAANGLFVEVKDVDSIVEKVLLLYRDRDLLRRLSKASRERILRDFSTSEYIKVLQSLYYKTL